MEPATGAEQGRAVVATHFRVRDGLIARVAHYGDTAAAVAAAGLRPSDEVIGA